MDAVSSILFRDNLNAALTRDHVTKCTMLSLKFVLLLLLLCLFDNLVGGAVHDHHLGGARGAETGHNSVSDAKSESHHPPLLMHCNVTGKTHKLHCSPYSHRVL